MIPLTIGIIVVSFLYFRSQHPAFTTVAVTRGAISQEVLASGNVAAPSTISLQFQNGGTLRSVTAATGDKVRAGQVLAQVDTSVTQAQLQQALAAVQTQQSLLATLMEGTRPEQLAITDSQVASDKSALAQANRSIINAIQTAYTQADDAITNKADQMISNPHSSNPQLSFGTSNSQMASSVLAERQGMEYVLQTWAQSFSQLASSGDLTTALAQAQANLSLASQFLSDLNAVLSSGIPNQQASQSTIVGWGTSLAAARLNMNSAMSALTTAATAEISATSALDKDQKTLALQQAGATNTTVQTQQALVDQAKANVSTIYAQLAQMQLTAPVPGTITNVNGDVGETVSPQTAVITMIPDKKLQINVNLSEDGVAKVRVGDPVRITLDAFPGVEKEGTVTSVDPAQTIVGGAVYYKTTVVFNTAEPDIKPGMTASVLIQTGTAQDALTVPASALHGTGLHSTVDVLVNGASQSRTVTTGLRGQDGMVEILSGISEGEQVITATQ